MNLTELLKLVPLIVGILWLVWIIFRSELVTKGGIGRILTYFLGVIIVFIAVGWLIDTFLISWANARLVNAANSAELEEFGANIETIFGNSLTSEDAGPIFNQAPVATPVSSSPSATVVPPDPDGGTQADPLPPATGADGSRPQTYIVQRGDNLTKIANMFGTTVQDLRTVNNLTSDVIFEGQTLRIPAR